MQTTTLYAKDFYAWTQRQAELLRVGQLGKLDIENLIEEIESLGRQGSTAFYPIYDLPNN